MRPVNSSIEARVAILQLEKGRVASKETSSRYDSSSAMASSKSTTVSIGGQAVLKQRLFGITDPGRDAPLLGKAQMGISSHYVAFLTRDDRRFLGEVYEWARDRGVDLQYVDSLGLNLASYREHDDGRTIGRLNQGTVYDGDGYARYYSFTEKDAATAKRILESDALKSTQLDQGFVRFITDKDYGGMHHNDFEFMEQVINRFSASHSDEPALGTRFAKHEYQKNNFIMTRSKEKHLDNADKTDTGLREKKITKPKEITLESLRADIRKAFMQGLGVSNLGSLFELLFKGRR